MEAGSKNEGVLIVPKLKELWTKNSTTLQLLLAQVVTAGTAFIVNILSANAMDPEGRGQLALLVQLTYVFTVAAMLGVERPFVAARRSGFTEALHELSRLLKPGYVLLLVLGASLVVLAAVGFPGLAMTGGLILLYLLGNISSRLVRTGYIASGAVPPFLAVSFATQGVLLAAAVILAVTSNESPEIWFLAYGVSGLIALVVVLYAIVRRWKGRVRRAAERNIRHEGLKLLPASFGNTAMLRSDRLLLPLLASNAQLGIYIVVATTMELASWPIQNWVDASLNRWRKEKRNGKKAGMRAVLFAVAGTSVLALVMGIVTLLLIHYVFDSSYAASEVLIIPLGIAAIVYAASRVQQGMMIASGLSHAVSWTEIIGMVVSVLGYILLIPTFGALGAAIASAVGYAACCAIGMVFIRKQILSGASIIASDNK